MSNSPFISRRRFLRDAPAATAATAATATAAAPSADQREARKKPLTVGALNIGVYSHLAAMWAQLINGDMSYTGMQITHCWDVDPARSEGFARQYGCQAVKTFDGMLGKVDAIISGGYYNHAWNHILHAPYLEAGIPNLINRPFTNSVGKARQMIELASKHKAPLLVPSALGHNDVVAKARQFVASSPVVGYHAAAGAEDYPTHGIHGLYFLSRVIADSGYPIESVSFRAKNWHAPPGLLTYEHRGKDDRRFFGTLHTGNFGVGALHIHTEKTGHGRTFELTIGTGAPFNQTEFWAPTLWAFQQVAQGQTMPQTYEQILAKNQAFMAGWRSHLIEQGRPVRLADVPPDWQAPVALPNRPGDPTYGQFRKAFGK